MRDIVQGPQLEEAYKKKEGKKKKERERERERHRQRKEKDKEKRERERERNRERERERERGRRDIVQGPQLKNAYKRKGREWIGEKRVCVCE